jgi:flagellar biosynthesis/type III secretory pathway protein FliH
MTRLSIAAPFGLAALLVTVPAHAQSSDWLQDLRPAYAPDARQSYYDARRAAYDTGYREGLKEGEKDGKHRDVFDYRDEKAWQRADKGFRRDLGSLERYQQSFRSGFTEGYNDAYQRYAPRNAHYGNGRYDTRPGPVYAPGRSTTYPRSYPGGGYPGSSGGAYNPAFQNGSNDGYDKGVEDARKNRSFDPLRHEWYRDGERHYESRYGSRDQYKDIYRDGFRSGYERGYRAS